MPAPQRLGHALFQFNVLISLLVYISDSTAQDPSDRKTTYCSTSGMLPTIYFPHGGGPLPLLNSPCHSTLSTFLSGLAKRVPTKPKAILLVSAHWEEEQPQITSSPDPGLLYDYYGFPPESYEIKYPAPGSPQLAEDAAQLLRSAGFKAQLNPKRALDHGAFIPLKLMYPDADIPVVQVSLMHSLDPESHYAMGAALAPLRQQGVLLLGSGMSYHGMATLRQGMGKVPGTNPATLPGQDFNQWLMKSCTKPPAERQQLLSSWPTAPGAQAAHPREEHLLPLMVMAGAAAADAGSNSSGSDGTGTGQSCDAAAAAAAAAAPAAAGDSAGGSDTAGHVLWDGEVMGTAVCAIAFGIVADS